MTPIASMRHGSESPALVPWIIAFKALKSLLLLGLGMTLLAAVRQDPVGLVLRAAYAIHLPATSGLFSRGLNLAMRATPRKEIAGALVAFAYSALMGAEGIALYMRKPWAPWFTIGATSSLLPIEVVEIIRQPRIGRVIVLVANVAVVVYLWRRRQMFAR